VPRNFVIQYSGREGSSAIISALSAQAGVNVPLLEELDSYEFLKTHSPKDYPQALDKVFTTGTFSGPRRKQGYVQAKPADSKIETTGFKWRVSGHIPDIAIVLIQNKVTVFALQRRDFLSYTCSIYIHKYGNQLQSDIDVALHPHFEKAQETKEGANSSQRLLMSQQDFPLVKHLFLKSAKEAISIRQQQAGKSKHLARAGVPVKMMYYEDFDKHAEKFIGQTLSELGVDIGHSYSPYCGFEKVHKKPLAERIFGIEKATGSWRFRLLERKYEDALKATKALATP